MGTTIKKRKVLIHDIRITAAAKHLPFEIKMPSGTSKITGVTITTSQLIP